MSRARFNELTLPLGRCGRPRGHLPHEWQDSDGDGWCCTGAPKPESDPQ